MNYKKLPKADEVEIIPAGDHEFRIMEVTDENKEHLIETAMQMYADEPCRICGAFLTIADIKNHAVFAGYSIDNKSRSAHKECWEHRPAKSEWAYPLDAVD